MIAANWKAPRKPCRALVAVAAVALIVSIHQRTVAVPQTTTTTTVNIALISSPLTIVVHLVVLIMITTMISLELIRRRRRHRCSMSSMEAAARSLVITIVLTTGITTLATIQQTHAVTAEGKVTGCIQDFERKSCPFRWPRSGSFDSAKSAKEFRFTLRLPIF